MRACRDCANVLDPRSQSVNQSRRSCSILQIRVTCKSWTFNYVDLEINEARLDLGNHNWGFTSLLCWLIVWFLREAQFYVYPIRYMLSTINDHCGRLEVNRRKHENLLAQSSNLFGDRVVFQFLIFIRENFSKETSHWIFKCSQRTFERKSRERSFRMKIQSYVAHSLHASSSWAVWWKR